jgi:hypothetical protein
LANAHCPSCGAVAGVAIGYRTVGNNVDGFKPSEVVCAYFSCVHAEDCPAGAAAVPSASADDVVFLTKGVDIAQGFDPATASGPVDWMKMIHDAKRESQAALARMPADAQWVYFEDEDGNPITGHVEIVAIGDDPVRHPEGREDPEEYA